MNSKKSDRRGFLKGSAALAGLAAFANGKALASVTPGLINGGNGDAPLPPSWALPLTNPPSRICYTAGVLATRPVYARTV